MLLAGYWLDRSEAGTFALLKKPLLLDACTAQQSGSRFVWCVLANKLSPNGQVQDQRPQLRHSPRRRGHQIEVLHQRRPHRRAVSRARFLRLQHRTHARAPSDSDKIAFS
jgi:hypothetical protein